MNHQYAITKANTTKTAILLAEMMSVPATGVGDRLDDWRQRWRRRWRRRRRQCDGARYRPRLFYVDLQLYGIPGERARVAPLSARKRVCAICGYVRVYTIVTD